MKIDFYASCYVVRKTKNKPVLSSLEMYAMKDEFQSELQAQIKNIEEFILAEFMKINPALKREFYCEFSAQIVKRGIISDVKDLIFREFSDKEIEQAKFWDHYNSRSEE